MTERLFDIEENAKRLLFEVGETAARFGREEGSVRLMAVTKTNSAERVNSAIKGGITLLGENRAQELLEKYEDYDKAGCEIHFIGHLQSNKVKSIIDRVQMIESADRLSLIREIDRCAALCNKVMPVLVEVNIGREESKSGVMPEMLEELLAEAAEFKHIKLSGLMAIPPNTDETAAKERYFEQMYRSFIDIKAKKMDNVSMDILSMGMTRDFSLAIKHGSNIVRIGRGLFGERL